MLTHEFSIEVLLHYLDDFLNVAGPSKEYAQRQLKIILDLFAYLGVLVATEKVEGPSQVLVFLGIILDTIRLKARLPVDKLLELRLLITSFIDNDHTTVRALESFLGKLSFAARVVTPGRTFMRRLWDLLAKFRYGEPHFRIRLPVGCIDDLKWWRILLDKWNGKAFFLQQEWTNSPDIGLYTDASGSIGWGAYYQSENRWIQGIWSSEHLQYNITYKELYAIVAACSTWGAHWSKRHIRFHRDNEAMVACLASGTSRSPEVTTLLRCLFMICAEHNFMVSALHIAGVTNNIADALSRSNLQVFRQLAPAARLQPDVMIPFPAVN